MIESYANQRIALLTQHGKERVIAPVLEPALGCRVERVEGYDTDSLGTFTRDTPRLGTQLDAARRKARLAIELSGASVGLGSEGSFGPDPMTGMFPWNVEVLVMIDVRQPLEIIAIQDGAANSGHLETAVWQSVVEFAESEAFPSHHMVMRPRDENDKRIYKGIASWPELERCFEECRQLADNGRVFVETDLRAYANPTRMDLIGATAVDLLHRLQSPCPACGLPGYWVIERLPGLPCAACATPTSRLRSEVWACGACQHRNEKAMAGDVFADPGQCPRCNP